MSPFRKANPRLSFHDWQFWVTIAYFALAVVFLIGFVENQHRVSDNRHAIAQLKEQTTRICRVGNDSRSASRRAWAAVESYIIAHSTTPSAKSRTVVFFDVVFGPAGHRDETGPLKNRYCN